MTVPSSAAEMHPSPSVSKSLKASRSCAVVASLMTTRAARAAPRHGRPRCPRGGECLSVENRSPNTRLRTRPSQVSLSDDETDYKKASPAREGREPLCPSATYDVRTPIIRGQQLVRTQEKAQRGPKMTELKCQKFIGSHCACTARANTSHEARQSVPPLEARNGGGRRCIRSDILLHGGSPAIVHWPVLQTAPQGMHGHQHRSVRVRAAAATAASKLSGCSGVARRAS